VLKISKIEGKAPSEYKEGSQLLSKMLKEEAPVKKATPPPPPTKNQSVKTELEMLVERQKTATTAEILEYSNSIHTP